MKKCVLSVGFGLGLPFSQLDACLGLWLAYGQMRTRRRGGSARVVVV